MLKPSKQENRLLLSPVTVKHKPQVLRLKGRKLIRICNKRCRICVLQKVLSILSSNHILQNCQRCLNQHIFAKLLWMLYIFFSRGIWFQSSLELISILRSKKLPSLLILIGSTPKRHSKMVVVSLKIYSNSHKMRRIISHQRPLNSWSHISILVHQMDQLSSIQ